MKGAGREKPYEVISVKLKIKEQRLKRKWSIGKLSALSGVSKGYISELEHDIYENPSVRLLCKLKNALGCTFDDLIECE
jgi:XRE family transcriptional regulator, master regulator for biofilm formation